MSYSVAAVDSSALTSTVLVWATRSDLAEALVAALAEPGRVVRRARTGRRSDQRAQLRVAPGGRVRAAASRSSRRSCAGRSCCSTLGVRRRISSPVGRTRSWRPCRKRRWRWIASSNTGGWRRRRRTDGSCRVGARAVADRSTRCGRARGSPSRRFVRFGSIALCGSCVEALRKLLRATETALVEADT